eukprot:1262944-Rhodomonas_salina.1
MQRAHVVCRANRLSDGGEWWFDDTRPGQLMENNEHVMLLPPARPGWLALCLLSSTFPLFSSVLTLLLLACLRVCVFACVRAFFFRLILGFRVRVLTHREGRCKGRPTTAGTRLRIAFLSREPERRVERERKERMQRDRGQTASRPRASFGAAHMCQSNARIRVDIDRLRRWVKHEVLADKGR